MTIQTPLHLQRGLLIHQRHLVHRAVAAIAPHALLDMNAVIKVDVVRKLIDPRPFQRLAAAVALPHRLQQCRIRPNLRMAVHAGLGGRNSGETRRLHRGMAVTAVNAKSGHVVLMTERNRLRLAHSRIGDIGRPLKLENHPAQNGHDKHRAKKRRAGENIRAAMKNLRHSI